ncbi:MAG: sigma 54-interacting transcriptional regulator [Polyangiaceae bacterium]
MRTTPRRIGGVPVKTLRVTVVGGPDAGRSATAMQDLLTVGTAEANDLILTDRSVSRLHLELRRKGSRIVVRDCASTNGTEVGVALLNDGEVSVTPSTTLRVGDTLLRVDDGEVVMVDAEGVDGFEGLLGRSTAMRRLFASIARLASTATPVLLVGESGTGKERIAEAIHRHGDPQRPFVTVDCGATVPTLFASELFGHERGAFTGADQRRDGAFARAHGGTLFLDEIGEVPLDLQSTLLGVLERRRFRRLGASSEQSVECRVVSATNRDLRGEVNAGRFRADLYYRLAVVTLQVPPLRQRTEDIPALVEHFLRAAGHPGAVEEIFPPDAMTELTRHSWPGNVRELRNVVESRLVMGLLGPDGHDAAAPTASAVPPPMTQITSYKDARREVLDRFEGEYLRRLLAETGGNVRQAARVAQMDRSYLMKLLKDHGLP